MAIFINRNTVLEGFFDFEQISERENHEGGQALFFSVETRGGARDPDRSGYFPKAWKLRYPPFCK